MKYLISVAISIGCGSSPAPNSERSPKIWAKHGGSGRDFMVS